MYGGGTRVVLLTTFRQEGFAGFYKGLVPNIVQRTPQSAITLTLYELILQALQRVGG